MNYLKTHILIVEDNYQDFILFKEILSHIRDFFIQIDHADSLTAALEKVSKNDFDIVFLDLFLPDSYGSDTFVAVQSVTSVPVVILSGLSDRKIALEIVKQGAQDYIVKGEFDSNLLEKSIIYSIERKKYQEVLEESERRSRTIFESIGIAIAEYDYSALHDLVAEAKASNASLDDFLGGLTLREVQAIRAKMQVLNMNPEALLLYGFSNREDFEREYTVFYSEAFVDYYREALRALWEGKDEMVYELPFENKDGKTVHTLKRWRFLGRQAGFYRLLVSSEDVSRIKENEDRFLQQSNVMEGIAKAASTLLGDGEINERLNKVMAIAGESLNGLCMSIYLFDFPQPDKVAFTRTHTWQKSDHHHHHPHQGVFVDEATVQLAQRLTAGEPVLAKRDEGYDGITSLLQMFDVDFTVITPFKSTVGKGCLTLSYDRRSALPDYVYSGVKTLASSIGSALATAQAQEALHQINEELEQRVDDRTAKMRQAIRELESFSYSVSHDLRAPLRTISGFTGVLHEEYSDKLDDEGRHFLENIRRGASEMSQLIDDLLNFSRMGRRKLQLERVEINALVSSVYDELRAQVPERTIEFTINELHPCMADNGLLRQVFVNLIWNAIKFTKKEAIAEINISSRLLETGWAEYTINDNGVGFNMKYADKLFGVFQRLHPHEDFDGTGVGLAIIQRIVTRHGGRVYAKGEENVGASFTFTMPTHRNQVNDEADND
jgi:signal transduction histidine kinase/DNA-binding NarL/FixJ family response regulator